MLWFVSWETYPSCVAITLLDFFFLTKSFNRWMMVCAHSVISLFLCGVRDLPPPTNVNETDSAVGKSLVYFSLWCWSIAWVEDETKAYPPWNPFFSNVCTITQVHLFLFLGDWQVVQPPRKCLVVSLVGFIFSLRRREAWNVGSIAFATVFGVRAL